MDNQAVSDAHEIKPKMMFSGKVIKTSLAGAVIDIGINQPAVIHISQISSSREAEQKKRVDDMLQIGQEIEVWVKRVKPDHVELTMVKPLDLEWRDIKEGMSVKGTIVRLEKFGAFVEIGAERPGLVHVSELAHGFVRQPSDVVKEGDTIEAQVLEVNRKKKQIKLSMKALIPEPEPEAETSSPVAQKGVENPGNEKPTRKKRNARNPRGGEKREKATAEPTAVEAEPTVMELAWQEAMERAKSKKKPAADRPVKSTGTSEAQEQILSRTLEHKEQQV